MGNQAATQVQKAAQSAAKPSPKPFPSTAPPTAPPAPLPAEVPPSTMPAPRAHAEVVASQPSKYVIPEMQASLIDQLNELGPVIKTSEVGMKMGPAPPMTNLSRIKIEDLEGKISEEELKSLLSNYRELKSSKSSLEDLVGTYKLDAQVIESIAKAIAVPHIQERKGVKYGVW